MTWEDEKDLSLCVVGWKGCSGFSTSLIYSTAFVAVMAKKYLDLRQLLYTGNKNIVKEKQKMQKCIS